MDEPWGLSGPEFLRMYWVGFAFALLFAAAVRIMVRAGVPAGGPPRHDQLSVHELAYLAGGGGRVVETAVARLIDLGRLRPSRRGTVQVVAGATATDAVDRAVLGDAARYGHRTLGLLIDRVATADEVRGIRAALVDKGLLVDGRAVRARLSAAPVAVLFAVGLARWANGVSSGRPIGWLTLALLATAVAGLLLYRRPVPERTYAGDRVLAEARRDHRAGRARAQADTALLGGAAMAVLFAGLAAYPDAEVSAALELQRQSAASSSSGSGCGGATAGCGSSSSGGSSCGGGGGGGCGGCGGGG